MDRTFVEKVLDAAVGSIVFREPDIVLSNDNSAEILSIFERIDGEKVYNPNQPVVVLDGKVAGLDANLSMEYESICDFVEEQGLTHFFGCDRGIAHQLLAGMLRPGMLVTGRDGHTATAGAFNCLALNIDKTETAFLWKTGKLWFSVPETIKITLKNSLPEGVTAKDLALWVMGILSGFDINGQLIEYHGNGISSLSISDRMTLANVSAEMGILCSVFPPDDVLADYFGESAIRGVWADTDAIYSRYIDIDLAKVFPLVLDTVSQQIKSVNELGGLAVQQGLIGGCASGRLDDLRLVAAVLEGRRIADGFQLYIVPASRDIYLQAVEEGIIKTIAASGATILGSGCGPCMGLGRMTSATNSRLISTTNSHFIGGKYTSGVEKYIASPLTIAMTALRGEVDTLIHFQDARFKYRPKNRETTMLEEYDLRKNGIIWNYSTVDNISCNQLFSEKLARRIDIKQPDQIKPYLFAGLDSHFSAEVKRGDIVIAGENFGCGRLNRHGVAGLVASGISLIIVKSADMDFYRMAINNGLLVLVNRELVRAYHSGDSLLVDLAGEQIRLNEQVFDLPRIDPDLYRMVLEGGLVCDL